MPLDAESVKELKQKIKLARNKELKFALALGKKPEDCALIMHKERGSDKLLLQVKKTEGVQPQKSCHGTLAVEGQLLKLSCLSDPPAGLLKNFRIFFRNNGIQMKLAVLAPGETEFQQDPEEGGAAPEAGSDQTSAQQDQAEESQTTEDSQQEVAAGQETEALKARLTRIRDAIAPLSGPVQAKLVEGLKRAAGLLSKGDLPKVDALLVQLEKALSQVEKAQAAKSATAEAKTPPEESAAPGDGTGDDGAKENGNGGADAPEASSSEDPRAGRWQQAFAKLEPHVTRVLGGEHGEVAKIQAVWDFAKGKAKAGDFAAALKAVGPLSTLLAAAAEAAKVARSAAPAAPPTETPAPKEAAAESAAPKKTSSTPDKPESDDPAKKQALEKLETARGVQARVAALIAKFGPPAPAPWASAQQQASAHLGISPEKEVAELEQAATAATKLMVELEPKVKELTEDKQTWEQTHPLYVARLVPIKAHAMKGIEPVKTKLAAMEAEIAAAEAEAAKFDFKKASGGIVSFLSRGDALEGQCDDLAHYRQIQADRKALVDPKRGAAPARAQVRKAIEALVAAYDDGKAKADAEDYEAAVTLMNKVPDLHEHVELLENRAKALDGDPAASYWVTKDGLLKVVQTNLTELNGFPANVKTLLKAGIDRCQAALDANQPAKQPDMVKAAENLNLALRETWDLLGRGRKAKAYVEKRGLFDAKLRDFKAHAGKAGIDDVITRMEADSASAASDAILRKFDSATRIITATEGDWPAYKTRADDYLAYKTKRDTVEARLTELRKKPEAAAATDELASCDGYLRQAATQGAARDYKSALDSVNACDGAADVAENLIEMRAELAKLKKDDVLAAVDKDVVAAFKNYEELAKYVEGKDDGSFATLRQAAAAEAQKGRDASTGASPDLGKVRTHLGAAIKQLEGVLERVACKASFTTLRAAIRPAVETELKDGSSANDNCLAADLTAITALLTEADNAVKAPGLDFGTGLAKVNEAQTAVAAARKKLALYVEAKNPKLWLDWAKGRLILSRDEALTHTNPIDAKESLQIEVDKVTAARAAFDTDWAAGKHAAAVAQVKKDRERCKAYEASRGDYVTAIKRRQDWIYDDEVNIAGDPLVQKERDEIAAAKVKIAALLQQRAFKAAAKVTNDDSFAIDRGKAILAARTAYEPKRQAAETKVQEAESECAKVAMNAELTAQAAALRARYTAAHASTAVPTRAFATAAPQMDQLATDCQGVIDAAKTYLEYETARALAETKIGAVKTPENQKLIAPMIARLDGKYANAVELAAKGNLGQAKALVDVLPQDCLDALAAAKNNAALGEIGDNLDGLDGEDGAAVTAEVAKLRGVFDVLSGEDAAKYAKGLAAVKAQVEALEAQVKTDPKGAKAAIPAALTSCEALQLEVSHHQQLAELANRITTRITDKTAPFVKYSIIQEDADALKAEVAAALKAARDGGDIAAGNAALEAAMDKLHALVQMAARHDQVIQDCEALEAQHKTLMGSEYRYAIREDLEQLDGAISQAREAAAGRDHDAAEAHVKTAKERAVDAVAKNKMAGNVPPDPKNIKAILDRPDGDKQLDEMIKGLDASAQRKVLKVAFEAKFGCKLNIYADAGGSSADRQAAGNLVAADAKKGPNIRRFYEVMSVLPTQDTRDNTSMKIFGYEDVEDQKGSVYSGGAKEVVMREGDAHLSDVYGFGRPHEVGEVDDNCKPVDQEQVDFFSWNTLHEAGHAVDDQRSFMKGVAGQKDYGGWQEHGGNVKPVADAIAGHYQYDPAYVAQYISGGGTPAEPECPADVDPEIWAQRRNKCRAHVDMARAKNDPWQSAAIAAKLNIGGRVYHESYKSGSWNSYDFGARKQAITGYQFRAPGEWFSEIYAAYHSKKLKDQHPAVKWLQKLN